MSGEKRLSSSELREVVASFGAQFPGWNKLTGRLVRTQGPIVQNIGFETLRSGGYRPVAGLRCVAIPEVAMLAQFLDMHFV